MEPSLPKTVGRYRIQRELGRGMMGVVYLAKDPVLGRSVALKTVRLGFAVSEKDRSAFARRFLTEARAAAALSHPGVVTVYDAGRDTETEALFIAFEYLEGRTLAEMTAGGSRVEMREALRLTVRVAEALQHAHSQGVVHHDIKPANIMVLPSGEPKIMDFGIAMLPTALLTAAGQILGSPSYMSPERGTDLPIDARSDVFSLGAVLYELLTGQKAFAASDVGSILMKVAYEDPPPPSRLSPDLPPDLDRVVARALAKAPDDRYPDGQALAEDLEDVLEGRPPRRLEAWTTPASTRDTLGSKMATALPEAPASQGEGTPQAGVSLELALPSGKRVSLAVMEGPRQGHIFPLDRPQVLIGREGGGSGAHL